MNAVGIDVSKGKSMVAVMRPYGEVVKAPFEVAHSGSELNELVSFIKSLDGETKVVMEYTGHYHSPIVSLLNDAGIFVSVINPLLVYNYSNNSLRRAKTDKKDAIKLANYALDHWFHLPKYCPVDDTRMLLKNCFRQYEQCVKLRTMMKNNLISLLDITFPDINRFFTSPQREDGREKWIDFVGTYWHCECVSALSIEEFKASYFDWCRSHGYNYSSDKAIEIHTSASGLTAFLPMNASVELMVKQSVSQLVSTSASMSKLRNEMSLLAEKLPEYPIVMSMYGVGKSLGPQLMAEIGDVRRFHSKKALVAFAGIDAPAYQSGTMDVHSRSISKRGSSSLRRTLFLVMSSIIQNAPENEPVFQFIDRKRSEGKPYKVYMMASANKFLRIYYATVKAYLDNLDAVEDKPLLHE